MQYDWKHAYAITLYTHMCCNTHPCHNIRGGLNKSPENVGTGNNYAKYGIQIISTFVVPLVKLW